MPGVPSPEAAIERAARAIREANALLITTGAGMGVDSGLPDFRGRHGVWAGDFGHDVKQLMSPKGLRERSGRAWGFYAEAVALFDRTPPHSGFLVLQRLAERMTEGYFGFTSNVDRHLQRAGLDPARIVECHGTMERLQCTVECGVGIFPQRGRVAVDPRTHEALAPLPSCPQCGAMARPNVLMFADFKWDGRISDLQRQRMNDWLDRVARSKARLAVIECGAGTTIATVRSMSELVTVDRQALLVRINPDEPMVPDGHISIARGAREALHAIAALV